MVNRFRIGNISSFSYIPSKTRIEIARKKIQEKCLPRVTTSEIMKLAKEVSTMILAIVAFEEDISRVSRIAANANQATVVRCHAKRSVRPVSRPLLNILGRCPLLIRGMRIKRSPKYE